MPLRKSHLYSSLWKSCDELRGGMDASQYKDYVLTLLFMKYVSDKYAGDDEFADIRVPAGGSFADMVALKGTKEIGDRIKKVIGRLADASDYLPKGVIDQADFNDESRLGSGKEMQDRVSKLVGIFEGLGFRANRAHGDDLPSDAYEYLMRHIATQFPTTRRFPRHRRGFRSEAAECLLSASKLPSVRIHSEGPSTPPRHSPSPDSTLELSAPPPGEWPTTCWSILNS